MDQLCYVSEHSEVDPKTRTMRLKSSNVCHLTCIWIAVLFW